MIKWDSKNVENLSEIDLLIKKMTLIFNKELLYDKMLAVCSVWIDLYMIGH